MSDRNVRPALNLEALEARVLLTTIPNDAYYAYEWGLRNTAATSAWDVTTGSAATVVADIDTGIDYTHPDLYQNIWINQDEIPTSLKSKLRDTDGDGVISSYDLNSSRNAGLVNDLNGNSYIDGADLLGAWSNGADGDRNGYVDDIVGWDFANNDNNPMDEVGHGTHTAGTIGATGNNGIGVTGVAWKVAMMAVKIFDDVGNSATNDAIAAAIRYVVNEGARVSNNSWGGSGGGGATAIYNAIKYASDKGHMFVVAAGNNGINNDTSYWRSYPASYDLPNVISVAASTSTGSLAYFSNYGRTSVDLAAPGTDILSTYLDGSYAFMSGTSMAAPHVTGTVALMLSQNPNKSISSIKSALMNGADQTLGLRYASASGGELNIGNALTGTTGQRISTTPIRGGTVRVFNNIFSDDRMIGAA